MNANAELIGILNNSEKKPILLYLNFKGDSCYNALTPIIDKLYSEFPSDCCFKINFSEENGKFLNLNQTKSKMILLYKGFRTTIYSGGEIESEYNGGEDFTESEVSQIIKERINRYLK
jgi:hypothetical protein